jgi:hypothetical protein
LGNQVAPQLGVTPATVGNASPFINEQGAVFQQTGTGGVMVSP